MYSTILALSVAVSGAAAAGKVQGFSYGATTRTGAAMYQSDFEAAFSAAQGLANTNGDFSSARLYTMIQSGTTSDPISAIPAAISSDTKLFLGIWCSGTTNIDNELAALTAAITKYGSDFTSRVNGISVGSEDLYRCTETSLENDPASIGAGPDFLVSAIKQVRAAIAGTSLSNALVGHVDTYDAWANSSNAAVIAEVDFLGMNTFPYFQTTDNNDISNGKSLFQDAYSQTQAVAGGKSVIITETGWPVGGANAKGGVSGKALASTANAKTYYDQVGCDMLFGKVDTYWYTLIDANTDTDNQPAFGVVGTTVATTPLFDMTCNSTTSTSANASTGSSPTSTRGVFAATGVSIPSNSSGSSVVSSSSSGSTGSSSLGSSTGSTSENGTISSGPATPSTTSSNDFTGSASLTTISSTLLGVAALIGATFLL